MNSYHPTIHPTSPLAQNVASMLRILGHAVGEVNVANGWDTSRDMVTHPEKYDPKWIATHKIAELGLIGTEVAEAIEEVRHEHAMTETYYHGSQETRSGVTTNAEEATYNGLPPKPEGVPSELADVVIRAVDIADAYGIDLGAAIIEKLNHNATRGLHHGGKTL